MAGAIPAVDENLEHFRTDHLVENLGKRAVSGGFLTAGAQAAKFVLNLGSAAALARLLSPKEFGLVGMVLAITGLLGLFKELGLSTATVQKETITQEQVSNLFWINVGLSGAAALASICMAPLVAWFYHDPRLIPIMLALSVTFLLTGSTVQHQALLLRQMRFRAIAIIEVVSMVAGVLTACSLAYFGFSYWALVYQQVCLAAATLGLIWWTSGWRPSLPRRGSGVRPMLRFGAHLTASDLVGRVAIASDSILVGRVFGAEALGLYSRGSVLLARPLEQLLTPISSVVIPVLSRLQSEPARYRRTFIRAFETLALLTFPFAALCLALAEPIVLVVLGPKWREVVPIFSGFALVAVSLPMSLTPSWLFTSQGRGKDLLQAYTITGGITVASFLVGLRWGPVGVVLSLAVASIFIRLPILYYLAGRRGPVSIGDLWNSFLCYLPYWVVVFVSTAYLRRIVAHMTPLAQLAICTPVGLAASLSMALSFARSRTSVMYAVNILRQSRLGRRSSTA
ncbi:MAG: lipopolysaccharide biosynthesis protein [Terriglobales bacterium]